MSKTLELRRLMADTLRLTRAGDLRGATAAIQAALGNRAARAGGPDTIDVEAHEVAREVPAAAPPVPPAAAAGPAAAGRFIAGRHADAAGARDYKLYLPPVSAGQALPLLLMLHGCTQDPDDFAAGTGMNELARQRGYCVLYPAQAGRANASRCWNWFKSQHQQRGRGEPALLVGMVRAVLAAHAIDARRVYVAGLSAGGAMAAILGEAYPDLFAAVGVHSGLPAGAASDLQTGLAAMQGGGARRAASGPVPPTIVFHGDQDGTVHPSNGDRVAAAAAGAALPETEAVRSADGRPCTRRLYRGADGRVVAEQWIVQGAGHAWFGGQAGGSYTDTSGPNASAEMLRFFDAHPLRADA